MFVYRCIELFNDWQPIKPSTHELRNPLQKQKLLTCGKNKSFQRTKDRRLSGLVVKTMAS